MDTRSLQKNGSSCGPSNGKDVPRNEVEHPTLLRTKLFVPSSQSTWIQRPRLIKRMDEGFARKLTLISAPAGFGKTTLLANWIHQKKIAAAWLSVDENDNDPIQFLTYAIAGLQTLEVGIGKAALTMLRSPQPPPIESILINLINDVIRIPTDMALVFDDYHLVDAKPIHDMIVFLLDHLPEQMHMIIATRADPNFPLARILSQNQMTELRAVDLSFTTDEISIFFDTCIKYRLSNDDITLLGSRTEGWIAGLQLAALSLSGCKEPSRFLQAFKGDNRYIADYLTEEVLSRQPEHLKNFMLQTCLLERLSGPLCDAVTQQQNSQQVLNTLEKANLFVIPIDDQRCWYRYHHLFANLLEQRLRRKQSDLVPELHRRASQWFAENGFKNEAVDHAFAAQDFSQAAQLIEAIAEIEWDHARESRLLRWLKALPNEQIETNAALCIFYARELYKSGYLDDAEKRLQAADQMLQPTSTSDPAKKGLQGRIAVIRAYISSQTGDVSRIIHFSSQALKSLPQGDLIWRSVAATTLGFAYGWRGAGDLVKAQLAFSEAMEISKTAGNVFYNIFAGICLVAVMQLRCQFKEAKVICQQSLLLANENGLSETEFAGSLYASLGMIFCEWNDLIEGIRLIKKGVELNKQGRDPLMLASCRINLFRALIYRMDFVGAFSVLKKLNESTREFRLPPWITNVVAANNVYSWLANGNLDAATQWAKEKGLSVDDEPTHLREPEHIALVYILIAQGQLDDADRLLKRLIENATAGDRVYVVIEMRLMRALILKAQQNRSAALGELKVALSLAEPGGLILIFVSKGMPVAELLEEIVAVRKRDHNDINVGFSLSYPKKILSAFKAVMQTKNEGLVDPVSDRELEVLHLIAAGLSNREIAKKLFISLNTVKSHTKSINSKLNVNSRTKAVARAKDMGLL